MTTASCKKAPYRGCYACMLDLNSSEYTDMGCYTAEEWELIIVKDRTGSVELDKYSYCQLKP